MPTKGDWKRQAQANAATVLRQVTIIRDWKRQARANAATIQRQAAMIHSLETWLAFERGRTKDEVERLRADSTNQEALMTGDMTALLSRAQRAEAEIERWKALDACKKARR